MIVVKTAVVRVILKYDGSNTVAKTTVLLNDNEKPRAPVLTISVYGGCEHSHNWYILCNGTSHFVQVVLSLLFKPCRSSEYRRGYEVLLSINLKYRWHKNTKVEVKRKCKHHFAPPLTPLWCNIKHVVLQPLLYTRLGAILTTGTAVTMCS